MENYDNLVDAMNVLRQEGCSEGFNIKTNILECTNGVYRLSPEEFAMDKFFRIEGGSNPDDTSMVYAISSEKHQVKGILAIAYAAYAEDVADELVQKCPIAFSQASQRRAGKQSKPQAPSPTNLGAG